MTDAVLSAEHLTRILPGIVPVTLVEDVTVRFEPGEFTVITGPSGSGKSSLLYLLGLLDAPSRGRVLLNGVDTTGFSAARLARLRLANIGFVFQFHFLLPEFTAFENVLIPMRRLGGASLAAMTERANALLGGLGLADKSGNRPDALSGGERQRVAIARALANDPALILADEPTGNLDTHNGALVFDIFKRLSRERGASVITVTHDRTLAAEADRIIRVVDGRLSD